MYFLTIESLNTSFYFCLCAIVGKKIMFLLTGGLVQNSNDPEEPAAATNVVRLFDTESNSWIQAARMLECRAYINAAVHKNTIYVAGGEDEHKKYNIFSCAYYYKI
jgi:N-acetylneuraminic acid mutarotase